MFSPNPIVDQYVYSGNSGSHKINSYKVPLLRLLAGDSPNLLIIQLSIFSILAELVTKEMCYYYLLL